MVVQSKFVATICLVALLLGTATERAGAQDAPARRPNFIVIFADDLGYGDLGCFGHPTIRTPELDRMAAEGMRCTQFYSAAPVCTPSRAALLTGRLPIRTGMCHDERRVLFPQSKSGLPESEWTLAEALHEAGYQTACVGKWHLGHLPDFLPTAQGFDRYFGIPYSNDMSPKISDRGRLLGWPPLPLMRDAEVIEEEPEQGELTERYTAEAISFIESCSQQPERPFFLYLPHTMPHVPLFASEAFAGRSARGLYGDVVETIDWSTGEILRTLREKDLAESTLVIFTSDNGPWLIKHLEGGSAGLLRGGKGSTWEGGMRVPTICWWPGRIAPGQTATAVGSTLDVLPTLTSLAGIELPSDRTFDGVDLTTVLDGERASPREEMVYYRGTQLMALRRGPWKAHLRTHDGYGGRPIETHDPPLLFHLERDPSETVNLAEKHPDVVAELLEALRAHAEALEAAPSQL